MKKDFTRRNFLRTAAGAAGLALATKAIALPEPAYAQQWATGPSGEMVQFGIIGIGMQGSGLLKASVELPGTKCLAACDLWDGRQTLAKEIAGPNIATTRQYQELLANKDITALIVAVPDHWHKQIVVDAMAAGKDVCGEKVGTHRADWLAAHQFRIAGEGQAALRPRRHRGIAVGRAFAGTQRSHRRVGVSSASRPRARQLRLGHLAGYCPQEGIRSHYLC